MSLFHYYSSRACFGRFELTVYSLRTAYVFFLPLAIPKSIYYPGRFLGVDDSSREPAISGHFYLIDLLEPHPTLLFGSEPPPELLRYGRFIYTALDVVITTELLSSQDPKRTEDSRFHISGLGTMCTLASFHDSRLLSSPVFYSLVLFKSLCLRWML